MDYFFEVTRKWTILWDVKLPFTLHFLSYNIVFSHVGTGDNEKYFNTGASSVSTTYGDNLGTIGSISINSIYGNEYGTLDVAAQALQRTLEDEFFYSISDKKIINAGAPYLYYYYEANQYFDYGDINEFYLPGYIFTNKYLGANNGETNEFTMLLITQYFADGSAYYYQPNYLYVSDDGTGQIGEDFGRYMDTSCYDNGNSQVCVESNDGGTVRANDSLYWFCEGGDPDKAIPMYMGSDGIAYVGTGNFLCEIQDRTTIIVKNSYDGTLDDCYEKEVSWVYRMGNYVEYIAKKSNKFECNSFIEFALAEGIKTKGNSRRELIADGIDSTYVIGMCTGHPRIVMALQTYTFGTEGTYFDDGLYDTTREGPGTVRGEIIQTLFDRVENDPTCEAIERKFASFGIFYQGWLPLQSDTDSLVDMYEPFLTTLDSISMGSLVTWPSDEQGDPANRDRARELYEKDWSTMFGFNLSDSAFFNKIMLTSTDKLTICSYFFSTFAEPGVDVDEEGNEAPRYQPIISDERYEIIWSALNYIGKISYLDDAPLDAYMDSEGNVRKNSNGMASAPMSLDSPGFIVWLFASRGLDLGVRPDDVSWSQIYANNPHIDGSYNFCPGDLIMYNTTPGQERGGIFLFYADEAHTQAYIIEMKDQGYDDKTVVFPTISEDGIPTGELLDYSTDIVDILTTRVGCVSLSLVEVTASCTKIVPASYNGLSFVPGCGETYSSHTGGIGDMKPTDEVIDAYQSLDDNDKEKVDFHITRPNEEE